MRNKLFYQLHLTTILISGLINPLHGYSSDKYHGLVIDYSVTAAGNSDLHEASDLEICSGQQVRFDVELHTSWDDDLKAKELRTITWKVDTGVEGAEPILETKDSKEATFVLTNYYKALTTEDFEDANGNLSSQEFTVKIEVSELRTDDHVWRDEEVDPHGTVRGIDHPEPVIRTVVVHPPHDPQNPCEPEAPEDRENVAFRGFVEMQEGREVTHDGEYYIETEWDEINYRNPLAKYTFTSTDEYDGFDSSTGCGEGIDSKPVTIDNWEIPWSVGIGIGPLSMGISGTIGQGEQTFQIFDSDRSDSHPGYWLHATAYNVEETLTSVEVSGNGYRTVYEWEGYWDYKDELTGEFFQDWTVVELKVGPEITNVTYRTCKMCCNN